MWPDVGIRLFYGKTGLAVLSTSTLRYLRVRMMNEQDVGDMSVGVTSSDAQPPAKVWNMIGKARHYDSEASLSLAEPGQSRKEKHVLSRTWARRQGVVVCTTIPATTSTCVCRNSAGSCR